MWKDFIMHSETDKQSKYCYSCVQVMLDENILNYCRTDIQVMAQMWVVV